MNDESLVLIPTYNEKENIERMVRKVFSLPHPFHLLIIDDGSPDGTADIVRKLQSEFEGRLFWKSGKESSVWAQPTFMDSNGHWQGSYQYIFEMDCDFSHNPDDLIRLYQACAVEGADVAIGSRYIRGANVVNWPLGRVIMSYYASVYVRIITGIRIMDTTAGFICYRRRVLETIELDRIRFIGYAFQIEMKFTAWKHGFRIVEVPIIFTDRTEGTSKMSKGIFKEAILGVMQMRWKSFSVSTKSKELIHVALVPHP